MQILKGDLSGLDFDLIVMAATPNLRPAAGLSMKVFSKAGQQLADLCKENGAIQHGDAIITPSFMAPYGSIIHCAAPLYIDGRHEEAELLKACYWNALVLAYSYLRQSHRPKIQVGISNLAAHSGFDPELAAYVAIDTIQSLMHEYPDAKALDITFVLENEKEYLRFKKAAGL